MEKVQNYLEEFHTNGAFYQSISLEKGNISSISASRTIFLFYLFFNKKRGGPSQEGVGRQLYLGWRFGHVQYEGGSIISNVKCKSHMMTFRNRFRLT